MPQGTTNDVISAAFALVITCLPLTVLAMIVLQWQKELNAASRMRRAAAWRVERSSPIPVPPGTERFLPGLSRPNSEIGAWRLGSYLSLQGRAEGHRATIKSLS